MLSPAQPTFRVFFADGTTRDITAADAAEARKKADARQGEIAKVKRVREENA